MTAISSDGTGLKGARVLVIEDDGMQLLAIQMLIESWGCRVTAVATAQSVEKLVRDAADVPDLILSDFRLPDGVSGIDAVERIRRAVGRDIPAILQTGDTDPALVRDVSARGHRLLHKPYDPNQLRQTMERLLADSRSATTA